MAEVLSRGMISPLGFGDKTIDISLNVSNRQQVGLTALIVAGHHFNASKANISSTT
jgi:hypothetical protein